jgi:hypothetical protein
MSQLLIARLVLGLCSLVVAAEPVATPKNDARFVAKITFSRFVAKDNHKTSFATEVAGTKGEPLKVNLGGVNGLRLLIDIREVENSRPAQYLAEIKLMEMGSDGRPRALSAPKIVTTAGQAAKVSVGVEGQDRTELSLTITEKTAANSDGPKPGDQTPAGKKPTSISTGPDGATSLMKMVNPRIIIQEEEEEKLGIEMP